MSQVVFPIPRNSLIWLLVAVSLALIPHFARLPVWMWLVVGVSLFWRVQVFRQRWGFPNKWLRLAFVCSGTAGIFYYYGTLLGPEAGVALLAVAYSFKLLEMYKERDAYIIVILSYFVLATNYLFERGIITTLYSLLVTVVVTASLVGLNQSRLNLDFKRTFRLATRMMLHSVPLMLVLFVLVPRIGPLWSMNIDNNKGKTGISDRMTPGDISELSKSSELAFRAEILSGSVPPQEQLYWRGTVFSNFDGRTWSVNKRDFNQKRALWVDAQFPYRPDPDEALNYRVFMEPTNQEWVFALPYAQISEFDVSLSQSLTWSKKEPITNSYSYQVSSYLGFQNQPNGLAPLTRQENLQLPPSGDLRSRGWAIKHFNRLNSDTEAFVRFILQYFSENGFAYTLRPTPLQTNTVDQLLFATKNGFCVHYAGAFVFLLRSAGVPARMVAGYQGGELHDSGKYVTVRQYSAHAWAEVWIQGVGWKRVDPTAAVAPERIFDGMEGLSSDENFLQDSPFSPYKMRNWPILSILRARLDHLDYLWSKWIVGYNSSMQYEFLGKFLGSVTPQKIAYALGGVGGLCILLYAFLLLRQGSKQKLDPVDQLYLSFCRKMSKAGVQRKSGEAPFDYAKRISEVRPELATSVNRIAALYAQQRYSRPVDTEINGKPISNHARLGPLYLQLKQEIKSLRA